MNRTPPKAVRQELRREVGFGCPIPGCGNPYLTWHHFNPPWHEKEHHNPEGMIALCLEHHKKADYGAFNVDQLLELKKSKAEEVSGRFDWMRSNVLGVVGSCFYYETHVLVAMDDQPLVWWSRDDRGSFLLNITFPTISGEERLRVEDNFFLGIGEPDDLECPPSGKKLSVVYRNGDSLDISFKELSSYNDIAQAYTVEPPKDIMAEMASRLPDGFSEKMLELMSHPSCPVPNDLIEKYPVTAVEISMKVGGTGIEFGPKWTKLPNQNQAKGCLVVRSPVGLNFGSQGGMSFGGKLAK